MLYRDIHVWSTSQCLITRLESLEAGAKDKSDFERWQSEMRRRDTELELEEVERRRLEGKISHEEAIIARQNIVEENRQRVAEMKEEVSEELCACAYVMN